MSTDTSRPTRGEPPDDRTDYECRKCGAPAEHGQQRCTDCGYAATGHRSKAAAKIKYWENVIATYKMTIVGIPIAKRWLVPKREHWEERHALGIAEPVDEGSE